MTIRAGFEDDSPTRRACAVAACAAGLFFTHQPAARADLSDADRDFVKQATEEVIGDASINRIARDKGEHDEVRHYAADRVHLDEKLELELRDIAGRHHISVPGKDELAKDAKDRLQSIQSSAHFDHDYLSGELRDTTEMAKLFKSASDGESDPELRTWFAGKLDTLRDSRDKVKTLDDQFDK